MLPDNLPRKKLLIFGSIILGILILLLFSLLRQRSKLQQSTEINNQVNTENPAPLPSSEFKTINSPKITFKTYNTNDIEVSIPDTIKTYNFVNGSSIPDITDIGGKFGLSESKTEGNTVILYNNDDETNRGYLTFNLNTGNYVYLSYGKYPLRRENGSLNENVRSFLLDKNLIDETVDCDISYERQDTSNVKFVECHRNWDKAGLPILNFAGLLNVPDLDNIRNLKVGMVDSNISQTNPNIINVSTGQNGYDRPGDFNTVTVAVNSDGNLVGITSNLKIIKDSSVFTKTDLYTPDEAVDIFKTNNNVRLSLIVPEDDSLAWENVFPDNTAYDLDADLNNVILSYIENPFGGKSLYPMYIARGTAQTKEGNSVKFLQAIPAIKNQQSFNLQAGEVAGLMAQSQPNPTQFNDDTLKLGTFQPDQRRDPQKNNADCVPRESQLSPILSLGDFGLIGKFTIGTEGALRKNTWFLIPNDTNDLPDINAVVSTFDTLGIPGESSEIRDLKNLQNEWKSFNLCPLRVTGASPTVFTYGFSGKNYQIQPSKIVYSNPRAINGLFTTRNGEYVYYEYQPISFDQPPLGWNISKDQIDLFSETFSASTGLNSQETSALKFELKLAANNIESQNLFIGLINENELNNKLPLQVIPEINIRRFNFYISKETGEATAPEIPKLIRTAEMLLEIGASAN